MGKLRTTATGVSFWCPGCQSEHHIRTADPAPWKYNGDPEAPTFTPSVLVTSGHHIKNRQKDAPCWCTFKERQGYDPGFTCTICHSFVTDGVIKFLDDCTHALKGQIVPLPDLPDHCLQS